MYGKAIGTLNFWTIEEGVPSSSLWSLSGNQGNMWRRASVPYQSIVPYQVRKNVFTG